MINTFDIDGVINLGDKYTGLRPGLNDIIITGRSKIDEGNYTLNWLLRRGITNTVIMNPVAFHEKSRENAGQHKADTLNRLLDNGIEVGLHFEDDPVQADIIERDCPRVKVVRIVHNLVEKENVWHGDANDQPSAGADA